MREYLTKTERVSLWKWEFLKNQENYQNSPNRSMAFKFSQEFERRRWQSLAQIDVPLDHQSIVSADTADKRFQFVVIRHCDLKTHRIILNLQTNYLFIGRDCVKVGDFWNVTPLGIDMNQ